MIAAAVLGFAHPARADSPDTSDTSTIAGVSVPDPASVADAATAAAQGGATNISVSVRIGSPGDNGDVSQTISVSTGAGSQQNSGAQAQPTQPAPSNVSISVRIDSPGSNGTVTQTTAAPASAPPPSTTQYQAPATQYPAQSTPAAPAAAPDPATPAAAPETSAAPDPAPAQPVTSGPSSWVWNLTVSGCGDTSGSDITTRIDTGIQGWIWNWNLGAMCQTQSPISPVNSAESGSGISPPSVPAPDPPTPPTITSPEPPALPFVPQPVIAAAQPAAIVVPVLGRIDLPVDLTPVGVSDDPIALPQALGFLSPVASRHARRHARTTLAQPDSGVLAASVTPEPPLNVITAQPVRDPRPAPRKTSTSHKAPPWETLSLILDSSFVPAAGGAAAGGAGAGAAGGAAAVLSLWLFLQLPGFAYLRLPVRQRRPRGRVDEKHTRPG